MKILVFSQYFYPENFRINTLCRELVQRGHQVTVVTGYPQYPYGKIYDGYGFGIPYETNWNGIQICRVKVHPRGSNLLGMLRNTVDYVVQAYGDKVEVFRPCARIVDFHAKGVSKIKAARRLQQTLGRKLLVCVGDAENDVPMLEGADYGYCPADGAVADRFENVCSCGEGAVADVIFEKIPEITALHP